MSRELGTLRAFSNGESQFLGSSSGVYFVDTVRQVFSTAAPGRATGQDSNFEACLIADEQSDLPQNEDRSLESHHQTVHHGSIVQNVLAQVPSFDDAKLLMTIYFHIWHPIMPFLHGPTFLEHLEDLYDQKSTDDMAYAIIFMSIFHIAAAERPGMMQASPGPPSPAEFMSLLAPLALNGDMSSIQALLSAQLYFTTRMYLRTASTIGGLVIRSLIKSGYHRCPFRYPQLSADDREMRKRIFWSAYNLDRFLSQALGHPLGLQDSDIDVCQPEHEIHEPTPRGIPQNGIPGLRPGAPLQALPASSIQQGGKLAVLANYVQYCQLTGRVLEVFHKSVNNRFLDQETILFLKADIEAWRNSLPTDLQDTVVERPSESAESPTFATFFDTLYQQLILLVNRPALSLEPSTADFRSSIQTCIAAAQRIILKLGPSAAVPSLFWPGYLSAIWMSGLIVAFASQLGMYAQSKASRAIDDCLSLLKASFSRWPTARHCHDALAALSLNSRTNLKRKNPTSHADSPKRQRIQPCGSEANPTTDGPVHGRQDHETGLGVESGIDVGIGHALLQLANRDNLPNSRSQHNLSVEGSSAQAAAQNGSEVEQQNFPMTNWSFVDPSVPQLDFQGDNFNFSSNDIFGAASWEVLFGRMDEETFL